MNTNPFAPPKADVADVTQDIVAPALWNPNAAANWSLLFTPAFGAFLHMKNWQALGEPDKASMAKGWVIASLFVIVLSAILTFVPKGGAITVFPRSIGIVLLLLWYFLNARAQAKYVKQNFANQYPRKGWGKPLLLALLVSFVYLVILTAITMFGTVMGRV